ncbi:MAG: hypothetical protein AB7J32_15650 [Pseudonocardia sp.]
MDFATARAFFFAPPAEGAPVPTPFTGTPSPARRLRDAIEPLACVAIWSDEAAARYTELGLDDWFAAYVWQRVAALGTPPTPLAVTAMGVWPAEVIGPLYEAASAVISRDDVVATRITGGGLTLRRRLGDIDADAARVVTALRRGIGAARTGARPMFSGMLADPWPDDHLAQLVHACNLLREHRFECHLAVCAVEGLDGVEMNILTGLYCGYPLLTYVGTRSWPEEAQLAAVERLRGRGLVEGDALSAEGLRYRGELEDRTDRMQQTVVDAIGPDLDVYVKQLDAWSTALIAADGAPSDPAKRAAG